MRNLLLRPGRLLVWVLQTTHTFAFTFVEEREELVLAFASIAPFTLCFTFLERTHHLLGQCALQWSSWPHKKHSRSAFPFPFSFLLLLCRQHHRPFADRGFVFTVHSKIGHEIRMHFERLVSGYGRKQLIPVYIEDNIFIFSGQEERSQQKPVL